MTEKENMILYDDVLSGLQPGIWTIATNQQLRQGAEKIETEGLSASRKIFIKDPIYAVKKDDIVQRMPLPGSQGRYTDQMVHLVIKGCIDVKSSGLFLLLLKKEEILLREEEPEGSSTMIQIGAGVLKKIFPEAEERPFYSHYRQVYIGNKPEMELDGIFTVFLANRLPEYEEKTAAYYEAHLVAAGGVEEELEKKCVSGETIQLKSLDAWEFAVTGKHQEGFKEICEKMKVNQRMEWLFRLPLPGDGRMSDSVKKRLRHGFVPMAYETRLGDGGICWNRSPFVPCRVEKVVDKAFYESADAAICYDEEDQMFDVSYAAAFEAGKMAACQDEAYMEALFLLRQELQRLLDNRYNRKIWKMENICLLQEWFVEVDWSAFSEGFDWKQIEAVREEHRLEVPTVDQKELEQFIWKTAERVSDKVEHLLQPVTKWLARLLLFYPLPMENLLPHEEVLPKENIRFFYVDPNWQQVLLEGALSIGLYSRRQSVFNRVMRVVLTEGTWKAMREYRAALYDEEPPKPKEQPWTGFMLRAEVAALWPTLSVQAWDADGKELAILRMQHLDSDILLAIFDGIAAKIVVNEPEECLTLKLNREKYGVFREGGSVLCLAPDRPEGLLARLQSQKEEKIGPALFARAFMTTGKRTIFGEGNQDE